ncbi:hypothetical protein ES703_27633 [subsurface metagenome]
MKNELGEHNKQGSHTVAIFSQSMFERLIPEKALQLFPLKPEPINAWNRRSLDTKRFLKYICDKQAEVTYADGVQRKVNYKSYWKTIFKNGLIKFRSTAKKFDSEAREYAPTPASIVRKVKIPSFLDDKYYGLVAKYYVCYDGIIDGSLSESYFFSISHMLETQQDLDCSILLAQRLYYKQSLQVLRNFVESLVALILFCHDSKAFYDWRKGTFRMPRRFRGKGSLLERLTIESQISPTLNKRTSTIYARLNSYIHSMERNLIHRGAYKGKYKGFIFDYDYFKIWCGVFSDVVHNGIFLLDAHFNQLAKLQNEGIKCSVCHNKRDFEAEEEEFAGTKYQRLKCKVCKSEMTIRA